MQMLTSIQLLDMMKEKLGSDYKTFKALNIGQTRVSKIRCGKGMWTNEQGIEIAKILGISEEFVILSLTAEREDNSNVRSILRTLADKFEPKNFAAGLLIGTLAAMHAFEPALSQFA